MYLKYYGLAGGVTVFRGVLWDYMLVLVHSSVHRYAPDVYAMMHSLFDALTHSPPPRGPPQSCCINPPVTRRVRSVASVISGDDRAGRARKQSTPQASAVAVVAGQKEGGGDLLVRERFAKCSNHASSIAIVWAVACHPVFVVFFGLQPPVRRRIK